VTRPVPSKAWRYWVAALVALLVVAPFAFDRARFFVGASAFPDTIRFVGLSAFSSQGGIREGCVFAALRLSTESAAPIRLDGLEYLEHLRIGADGTSLSAWQIYPENPSPDFLMPTCGNNSRYEAEAAGEVGYYAQFNNGEGMLVIYPASRIGYFYYWG